MAESTRFRILLVDDHPIFRDGLAKYICATTDLHVCGEAASVSEALSAIEEANPHLIIVDLHLKESSGFDLVETVRFRWPDLHILILTMYDELRFAKRLLNMGVAGYVMKDEGPSVVLEAIRIVLSGDMFASQQLQQHILENGLDESPIARLTNRELEIFRLIGEGTPIAETAHILNRSSKTIQNHVHKIEDKLQIPSRQAFYQFAREWVMTPSD